VLAVESVADQCFVRIQLIKYKVGVVLMGRCENDQLEYLAHFLQELSTKRSHFELAQLCIEVHQSLIEIQYESVPLITSLHLWQQK